eukprot:scaffold132494_cov36-Tisochrysis_lutea.AAC.1
MRQRVPATPGSAVLTSPDVNVRRCRSVTPYFMSEGSLVHQSNTWRMGVSKVRMPSDTTPAIARAAGNLELEARMRRLDMVSRPFSNVCFRPEASPAEKLTCGRKEKLPIMRSTSPHSGWGPAPWRSRGGAGATGVLRTALRKAGSSHSGRSADAAPARSARVSGGER